MLDSNLTQIDTVVINKAQGSKISDEVKHEFDNQKIALFPLSTKGLLGYEILKEYINTKLMAN